MYNNKIDHIILNEKLSKNYKIYLYLILRIRKIFGITVQYIILTQNEIHVFIKKQIFIIFLNWLKNNSWSLYDLLIDIFAIDYLGKNLRFELVYQLLSLTYNSRISVIVKLKDLEPIESSTTIFNNAHWAEREVWDLSGIYFEKHKDLRRILTDYSFEGHPLRKDFPLVGFFEIFYNDSLKRIQYEPVRLNQNWRAVHFLNPWKN